MAQARPSYMPCQLELHLLFLSLLECQRLKQREYYKSIELEALGNYLTIVLSSHRRLVIALRQIRVGLHCRLGIGRRYLAFVHPSARPGAVAHHQGQLRHLARPAGSGSYCSLGNSLCYELELELINRSVEVSNDQRKRRFEASGAFESIGRHC